MYRRATNITRLKNIKADSYDRCTVHVIWHVAVSRIFFISLPKKTWKSLYACVRNSDESRDWDFLFLSTLSPVGMQFEIYLSVRWQEELLVSRFLVWLLVAPITYWMIRRLKIHCNLKRTEFLLKHWRRDIWSVAQRTRRSTKIRRIDGTY